MEKTQGIVPLIDIAPFLAGTDEGKREVAVAVNDACRKIGFLVVKGHGVPASLIADMYRVSDAYFALPAWEKMALKMPPDRYRGYTPLGSESLA
ncbi:MAG: 2-oxoglutarate and iron-dependent oxygenase domain-containing protein, partial [Rhodospirillales bacterium]